jgi:hypothetical protein
MQSRELALKSMLFESADKSTSIPRENEAPSVPSHPGIGIVRPSPQITPLSEEQITNMIGCWKAPKSDVIPAI